MKNCPNNNYGGNPLYRDTDEERKASDVFERFISDKMSKGLSDYTLTTYRNHFNFFLKCIGGDCDVREITTFHYNEFVKIMKSREVSSATIRSYANSLRSFFNWCYENGEIHSIVYIPNMKAQDTIKITYTDEELEKLLRKPNVLTCSFTEYKVWVLENLVLCTGLRITSLINIKVGEINFDDCSIVVNKTKNKKALVTYFNKDMKRILQEYLSYRRPETNEDFLFCTNVGKKIARRTIQDEIADYNLSRGVKKTSVHLFKHTFARNAILAGMDVFTLMGILQHKDIATTYRYLKTLRLDFKDRVDIYNPQKKFSCNTQKIRMR